MYYGIIPSLHVYFSYFRQLFQSIHSKQQREIWNWTQIKHRESLLKLEGIFSLTVSLHKWRVKKDMVRFSAVLLGLQQVLHNCPVCIIQAWYLE